MRHTLEMPGWRYCALLLSWEWPAARANGLEWHPFSYCYLMRWKLDFTGEGNSAAKCVVRVGSGLAGSRAGVPLHGSNGRGAVSHGRPFRVTVPPLKVLLPWPPAALSPNGRKHRMAVAKVKKKYRADCAWSTIAAGVRRIAAPGSRVYITFHPPDGRPRDTDNMVASIKAGLDGVADVIGIDDSRWTLVIARGAPRSPGRVELSLEPLHGRP